MRRGEAIQAARPTARLRAAAAAMVLGLGAALFGAPLIGGGPGDATAQSAQGRAAALRPLGAPLEPIYAAGPVFSRSGDGVVTCALSLTQAVEVDAFVLSNPTRLVVDLPELHWGFLSGSAPIGPDARSAGVAGVRVGLFQPGRSRLVVDFVAGAQLIDARVVGERLDGPSRLVVRFAAAAPGALPETRTADVAPTRRRAAGRVVAAQPPAAPPHAPSVRIVPPPSVQPIPGQTAVPRTIAPPAVVPPTSGGVPAPRPRPYRPVIVLDAGHGGRDSGAAPPGAGVQEKTITLDFTRRLRAELQRRGGFDVVVTRDADVFIELEDRVAIAQQAGADLFLSIHADSNPRRVSGASVYTLSDTASDALADELARRENGGLTGVELAQQQEALREIVVDLARRRAGDGAHRFAELIVDAFRARDIPVLRRRPHRQAGFVVLKNFEAPAALLELGFLTNPRDLRRLTNPAWRETAAQAVADAIERWAATQAPAAVRRAARWRR